MIYNEERKDLFKVENDYYLVHCISADFGMGKGIVTEFNKRFNMKKRLKSTYPNFLNQWDNLNMNASCLKINNVFNLVTKRNYFNKPTYKSITNALDLLKAECIKYNVNKLAMPTIGCGLDGLQWNKVSNIIKNIFNDTDIEILVCKLK